MDSLFIYNELLINFNKTNYPFNLINNLKDNIINTRKEIELEYSKDFQIYKDINLENSKKNIKGKNECIISVYLY